MGAFAAAVEIFTSQGVGVIPTRFGAPSMPMVKYPDRFGVPGSRRLAENPRFENANAAIWVGRRSRLTIVDIDSPDPVHAAEAIKAFGDTPLKVSTPSGGLHLYYRYGGEPRRIKPFGKSLPLDILGDGLAVVPPSAREATGKKAAGQYRVVEGDLTDLAVLPLLRSRALPTQRQAYVVAPASGNVFGQMREGDGRDNALFAHARTLAMSCASEAQLVQAVLVENAKMAEPLHTAVASAKAVSAWRYKIEGRLMVSGTRSAVMDLEAIEHCSGNPVAFMLLAYLRSHHGPGHTFAIVPRAVARILGLSHNTVRKARDMLINAGYLVLERSGGGMVRTTGDGIPNLYRLTNPV